MFHNTDLLPVPRRPLFRPVPANGATDVPPLLLPLSTASGSPRVAVGALTDVL